MPPPTAAEKERTAQLVASLPRREQAELLAQALLREYMHRRGFTNTLAAFDAENPRDERAIASRVIMKRLLNIPVEGRPSRLQPAAARDTSGEKKKSAKSAGAPAPTFMEELCSYRLTKREFAQKDKARRHLTHAPHTHVGAEDTGEERQARDPSDVEREALEAQVAARVAAEREALALVAEYESLQQAAAAVASAVGAGDGQETDTAASDSDASHSEADSDRERRRQERRRRKKEKKRREREAQKKKHKRGSGSDAGLVHDDQHHHHHHLHPHRHHQRHHDKDDEGSRSGEAEDFDSAEEAYGIAARAALSSSGSAAPVASVGSRWAPPGLTVPAAAAADPFASSPSSSFPLHTASRSGAGGGGASSSSSSELLLGSGSSQQPAAAAAALPEGPVYDAGTGMTLHGATAAATTATSAASPATTGATGAAAGGGGGRPLLSRSDITGVWQPSSSGSSGGAVSNRAAAPTTALGLRGGLSLLAAGGAGRETEPLRAPQHHVDAFTPSRSGALEKEGVLSRGSTGGVGGLRSSRTGAGFTSSPSRETTGPEPDTPPGLGAQHSYDRSAQPLSSALASSGRFSGAGGGSAAQARIGVGFNTATPASAAARAAPQPSSLLSPSPSLASKSQGTAAKEPVFRSAVDAVPGSDGLRHGFGFHNKPNGDGAATAAAGGSGDGAKKRRKVTLLVD